MLPVPGAYQPSGDQLRLRTTHRLKYKRNCQCCGSDFRFGRAAGAQRSPDMKIGYIRQMKSTGDNADP
jgi:hypothetical protein